MKGKNLEMTRPWLFFASHLLLLFLEQIQAYFLITVLVSYGLDTLEITGKHGFNSENLSLGKTEGKIFVSLIEFMKVERFLFFFSYLVQ